MVGLTDSPRATALLMTSLLARLPLAMFSISLLVHVHRLTDSFTVAGAASGAYVIGRGLTSPLLGRLVDRHGQKQVLIGCATAASATLLVAVALLPASVPHPLVVGLSGMIGTVSWLLRPERRPKRSPGSSAPARREHRSALPPPGRSARPRDRRRRSRLPRAPGHWPC